MGKKSIKTMFENLIELAEKSDSQALDDKFYKKTSQCPCPVEQKPDGKLHLGIYDRDYQEIVSFWEGVTESKILSQGLIMDLEFLLDKLDGSEDQIIDLVKVKEAIAILPEKVLENMLIIRLNKSLSLNLDTYKRHPYSPFKRSLARSHIEQIQDFAEIYGLDLMKVDINSRAYENFPDHLDEIFFINESRKYAIDHNDLLPVKELILSGENAQVYVNGGLIKEPTSLKIAIHNKNNELNLEFLPAGSRLEFETLDGDYFSLDSIDLGADITYTPNNFSIKANHANIDISGNINETFKLTMYDMGPQSRINIFRKKTKEKTSS